MLHTMGPDVARAAVALRESHPQVAALEVLDVVLRHGTGRLADFGDVLQPATPFGAIVAEAFDTGMAAQDWSLAVHPNSPPALVAALLQVWASEVLPKFAGRYGLTP